MAELVDVCCREICCGGLLTMLKAGRRAVKCSAMSNGDRPLRRRRHGKTNHELTDDCLLLAAELLQDGNDDEEELRIGYLGLGWWSLVYVCLQLALRPQHKHKPKPNLNLVPKCISRAMRGWSGFNAGPSPELNAEMSDEWWRRNKTSVDEDVVRMRANRRTWAALRPAMQRRTANGLRHIAKLAHWHLHSTSRKGTANGERLLEAFGGRNCW
ncbi:hypothetical protein B0T19DRAFT_488796 [Cercophora scortea]|uniref:Uncharacterized protein n=1 Tax=Cercophora scortea TaxID=314031 RepID=A0AAE0I2Y4_9PEZI|nr:hypothetical protein B0T19DRAFT_488796 [Cercophora scortea]